MEYEQLLQKLKNEVVPSNSPSQYWRRYEDIVNSMSAEQRNWVQKQNSVIEAKQGMFAIFLEYLFEQNRDAFVSVGEGKFRTIVDSYIDTVQKTADSFVSRADKLEKENEELKEQLKRFLEKGGTNESMATNGSRQSRSDNFTKDFRANDNSGQIGENFIDVQDKSK